MTYQRLVAAGWIVASSFVFSGLAIRPAVASDSGAAMATVNGFVSAFNKGSAAGMSALCASPAYILDDFPPHVWTGPTACADWAKALDAANASAGFTDGIVTLGKPWHVNVDGNIAYVVAPASYAYNIHGKPTKETGSVWTVVLKKMAQGWRIISWAWAQH
jgi:ketosteroid isomerase-like protein